MAQMIDLFWAIVMAKTFTYCIVLGFVGIICWFMTSIMERSDLAFWFAPFLTFGGLTANFLLGTTLVLPTSDKDVNVAFASAVGVFGTLMLLLSAVALSVAVAERRARKIEGRTFGLPTAGGNGR